MNNFIQWHEGMLLSPHHFQQSDSNIQHLFSVFGAAHSAFYYGVFDMKVDTAALSSGMIRILKIRGIFQDGYSFNFDAVHDYPLEKNLSEYFLVNAAPIKIYIGIPIRKNGQNELMGDMARYYSDEIVNVFDENTGENPINIPVLRPKLKLLTEKEVDARYASFPILEIEKSVDGGVVDTKFIPPYIAIDEHSCIAEMCRDIVQVIRNKIAYFCDRKNNYNTNSAEESMSSLKLLIQAALPLEAIIKVNGIQPFEVYKCFIDAVTKIIAINPSQLIPILPVYNHEDLFLTFNGLLQYAKNILERLKQQYNIIRFDKEDQMFKLQMKKEWLEKDEITIGIQNSFSCSDYDLLNWINGVQIASESMIPLLRDRRVLGAERTILERGAYITQPNNMKIISVKSKSAYIKPMEKLCLINNTSQHIIPEGVILYADC